MKLTIEQTTFLMELFGKYHDKLYIQMRKMGYKINDIMSFVNGYRHVWKHYLSHLNMHNKSIIDEKVGMFYTPLCDLYITSYENIDEIIDYIDSMENVIANNINDKDKWEAIGIRYAVALSKFYVQCVLSGKDTEVEDELYMDIPDKEDPDSYDWSERGINW